LFTASGASGQCFCVVRLFKRTGIVLRLLKERHFSMHAYAHRNHLLIG